MGSDRDDLQKRKPLALLNMDTTLLLKDDLVNTSLIKALKNQDIQDVCLLTDLSAEDMLGEDSEKNKARYAKIKKLLEDNDFVVRAVVTPIDPIYENGKGLGNAWDDYLEPSDAEERNAITNQSILWHWAYHDILMKLVDAAIQGSLTQVILEDDIIPSLFKINKEIFQLLEKNNENPKLLSKKQVLGLTNMINWYAKIITALQEKSGQLPYEGQLLSGPSALDLIKDVANLTELSWIEEIYNLLTRGESLAFWNRKSSMYACAVQSALLEDDFDRFILLDTDSNYLKNMAGLHPALSDNPLTTITIHPGLANRDNTYRDQLSKKSEEVYDDREQVEPIPKKDTKLSANLLSRYYEILCNALAHLYYQLRAKPDTKKLFFDRNELQNVNTPEKTPNSATPQKSSKK